MQKATASPIRLAAHIAAAAAMLLALAGCSSVNSMLGGNSEADALTNLKWSYAANGIELAVTAAPELNRSKDQAHTLLLVVVQMEDPNAFSRAAASPAQLSALLLSPAAPDGMLSLNRIYVAPGTTQNIALPRVEKAQYVGVAAGYYHLDPARSTRLYRFGVDVTASGIVIKNRTATPQPLQITLQLGADGIVEGPGGKASTPPPVRPTGGLVPPPPPQGAAQ